jgi:hypothetical protein
MKLLFGSIFISLVHCAPQTPEQKQVVADLYEPSRTASMAAFGETEALFRKPETKKYLKKFDDGSGLWKESPETLARRFWEEIDAAEVVHSFGDGDWAGANCGFDLTVDLGMKKKVFPNQWELQVSGEMPVDTTNNDFMEWSEVNLFNFPPFANTSTPDRQTSVSRPLYGAINMYRASGGNPQCGPVAAVLSREYIGMEAIVTPIDTGLYNGACAVGGGGNGSATPPYANCSAWTEPRTLALPGNALERHLLETFVNFWNATRDVAGSDYPSYNLARLTIRLLSAQTYLLSKPDSNSNDKRDMAAPSEAIRLNFVENALGYFELNPAVAVTMKEGVKMLIGMFELLWGTPQGEQLQQWCIQEGWPLVWAYNPLMSFFRCGPSGTYSQCVLPPSLSDGIDTVNLRILDLQVLPLSKVATNISVSSTNMDFFHAAWQKTDARAASREQLDASWNALTAQLWGDAAVEPLRAGACVAPACVGTLVSSGDCLCP